jgi:hypothetical protein
MDGQKKSRFLGHRDAKYFQLSQASAGEVSHRVQLP